MDLPKILSEILFSEYISYGIAKQVDKHLYQDILDTISQFNEKYQGTSLDGNAFDSFIRDTETIKQIFRSVFSGNDVIKTDVEEFISNISDEAIIHVNKTHSKYGRNPITDNKCYYEYFKELRQILVTRRQMIQSLPQQALAAQIIEGIKESKGKRLDNTFAEDSIQDVEHLQDKLSFRESLNKIDKILSEKEILSDEQQQRLLFLKCVAYLNLKNEIELGKCLKKLHKENSNSFFPIEIDFKRILGNPDFSLFEEIKQKYIRLGLGTYELILYESDYLVSVERFTDAEKLLLKDGELIPRFGNNDRARFLYGIILTTYNKLEQAIDEFNKAYQLKNKEIYRLNQLLCQANIELYSQDNYQIKDKNYIARILKLADDLIEFKDYISLQNETFAANFWAIVLNLLLDISDSKFLEVFNSISDAYMKSISIQSILAAYYFLTNDFEKAEPILNDIWDYSDANIVNYFAILVHERRWSEIIEKCESKGIKIIEESAIFSSFYCKARFELFGYESIRSQLISIIKKFINSVGLVSQLFEIVLTNEDTETSKKIIEIILKNSPCLTPNQILTIAKVPYNYKKYDYVLELLLGFIENSESCLLSFIQTLGKINPDTIDLSNIDALMKIYNNGNHNRDLMIFLSYIYQSLKHFSISKEIIHKYIQYYGIDENSASIDLANKVNLSDFSETKEDVEILEQSLNPLNVMLVAALRAKEGNYQDAKRIALKSLLLSKDEINKEILQAAITQVYFTNFNQHSQEVEYKKVIDDSVITLTNDSIVRRIAIFKDNQLQFISGDLIFGCESFKSTDSISIKLKLHGRLEGSISLDGVRYKVKEILDLNVYIARFCLTKYGEIEPDSDIIKLVKTSKDENIVDTMKKILIPFDAKKKRIMDEYNLSDTIGRSLSYISGSNLDRYIELVQYLLAPNSQCFYTGECIIYEKPRKYLLTLSTLVTINILNLNEDIIKSDAEIYITEETYNTILSGARESIENIDSVSLMLHTNEDAGLIPIEISSAEKENKKYFLGNLVELIDNKKISVVKERKKTTTEYLEYIELFEDYDLSSILYCSENKYIMVCDDKFIREYGPFVNSTLTSTNLVGFLYSEKILDMTNMLKLQNKLCELSYIQSTNSTALFDFLLEFHAEKDLVRKNVIKSNISGIVNAISKTEIKNYYLNVIADFLRMVQESAIDLQYLYGFILNELKDLFKEE